MNIPLFCTKEVSGVLEFNSRRGRETVKKTHRKVGNWNELTRIVEDYWLSPLVR